MNYLLSGLRHQLLAVACLLAPMLTSASSQETKHPQSEHGPLYRLVNRTSKFTDDQVFWSLNMGKDWHSFAKEPTVPCPRGNGRLYFYVGTAPRHLGDRDAYWDFIEYASENSETWHGNTTQVDAFC